MPFCTLKNAEDALQRFPDIEWGGIVETVLRKWRIRNRFEPCRTLPYLTGRVTEVKHPKQIEQTNGRTPDSKRKDASRLTLTCFPTTSRYQTEDWQKEYVSGLSSRQFHVTQTGIAHPCDSYCDMTLAESRCRNSLRLYLTAAATQGVRCQTTGAGLDQEK